MAGGEGVARRVVGTQFADAVFHGVDRGAHHRIGGGADEQAVAEIVTVAHPGDFGATHKPHKGRVLQIVVDAHGRIAAPFIEELPHLAFALEEKTAVGQSGHADGRQADGDGNLPKGRKARKVRVGEYEQGVAGGAVALLDRLQEVVSLCSNKGGIAGRVADGHTVDCAERLLAGHRCDFSAVICAEGEQGTNEEKEK